MKPEQYKITDNGIWIPLEELQRLCDALDEEQSAERKKKNHRGASILFGRALSYADLLIMVEDAGKDAIVEEPADVRRIPKPRLSSFADAVRRYVCPTKDDAFCSRSELLKHLHDFEKMIK